MVTSTNLGRVSIVPRGAYIPSETYNFLDLVQYKGSSFLVLHDNVQNVAPVNGQDYMLVVERGTPGAIGNSIQDITRTSGNGAPGTTDTYTVTLTDGSQTTFQVYNGKDGTGAGDMTSSVYDPQGRRTDIFQYVDSHNSANAVTVPDGGTIDLSKIPDLTSGPWTFEMTIESRDANGNLIEVKQGPPGDPGATYTPSVNSAGTLSWTNNASLPNPPAVNIKGADGKDGKDGAPGLKGDPGKGIPTGGLVGQVLAKVTDGDYDTQWVFPGTTGGGIDHSTLLNRDSVNQHPMEAITGLLQELADLRAQINSIPIVRVMSNAELQDLLTQQGGTINA